MKDKEKKRRNKNRFSKIGKKKCRKWKTRKKGKRIKTNSRR